MRAKIGPADALLVIDVQNDRCPGGAIAVPDGDQVIAPIDTLMARFAEAARPVVLTRDEHPNGHASFVGAGGDRPPHCVTDTPGAAFHSGLEVPVGAKTIAHGSAGRGHPDSVFDGTGLSGWLHAHDAHRLFVTGLALDDTLRASALDALRGGFQVVVVRDATRPSDPDPGHVDHVWRELLAAGAVLLDHDEIR